MKFWLMKSEPDECSIDDALAAPERIAVMAALNVAHELLSVKLGSGFDMGQAKTRLSAIESQLDAAIAKQEKLF